MSAFKRKSQSPSKRSSRSRNASTGRPLEKGVQQSILDFLALYKRKVTVFPVPNNATLGNPDSGKTFWAGVYPGVPDICGWKPRKVRIPGGVGDMRQFDTFPQFLGIEVKRDEEEKNRWLRMESGELKKDKRFIGQKQWKDLIMNAGGIWVLACCLEDVEFLVKG